MEWTKRNIIERYKTIVDDDGERESDRTAALKEMLKHNKSWALEKLQSLADKNAVFALKILYVNADRKDDEDKLKSIEEM